MSYTLSRSGTASSSSSSTSNIYFFLSSTLSRPLIYSGMLIATVYTTSGTNIYNPMSGGGHCQLYNNNGTYSGQTYQSILLVDIFGFNIYNIGIPLGANFQQGTTTPAAVVLAGKIANNVSFRYTITFVGNIVDSTGGTPSNISNSLLLAACNGIVL